LSAGQLSAFVFYAVVVATSVGAISEVVGDLQRAAGATERLFEILDTPADIAPPPAPAALPEPPLGTVALEAVTFAYPSRTADPALRALTLRVAAGERVALVGPSGAGKTTVFQLLLRFYDPQHGRVLIDSIDVRTATPKSVRERIALVPQEPVIFAANVWDNVRYGRPQASDDEVREACEAAFASEFIARMPRGFDTELGERGVKLSGGQRQRLAIARAVLARRPILLLDEATSALDSESERMVQLALDRLMSGRTTLIIAHRLATVISANRIIVLDGGVAVAQGTHATLVRDDPLYRRLASLQFGLEGASGASEPALAVAPSV
jgi:ATP-binding cassette subfamily B protein